MIAEYLNALGPDAARVALGRCCGSRRWVEAMLAAGPFPDDDAVFGAAERAWWALGPDDWREAFAQHPRIGEPEGAGAWERAEQAGVAGATGETRRALARGNREYERRFGHVFLVCAAGRSAHQLLTELRRRLAHDPADELRVAAAEQAKITRLRLEKLGPP
ncbi:MAG TPA: 2-oxo-4-hydroxy-4-carboxy-5-ureidoimidazoline decarboxylase [Gemmatimonadales bacterium]|nr:2-oxo-4-hydroxy-4-carboxy-5-ureidoimidazoline decarboxylase [Gemmatimonadales bacterium]